MRKPLQFDAFPAALAERAPWPPYRAVVERWVDGDTLDIFADAGWNEYPYRTIRLQGIDAPELNRRATQARGAAARDYAMTLAPPGTPCVVLAEPDTQTFGRYVAVVTLADGTDVGAALVAAGHAVIVTAEG